MEDDPTEDDQLDHGAVDEAPASPTSIAWADPKLSPSMSQLTEIGSQTEGLKKLVGKELALQMERLNAQLQYTFTLYPKTTWDHQVVDNLRQRPIRNMKLTDHPTDLADKVTSQARITQLLVYAEEVMKKAESSDPTQTDSSDKLVPRDMLTLENNCRRILASLKEAIHLQRAKENVISAEAAVSNFKFPSRIEDLKMQWEVEKLGTLA